MYRDGIMQLAAESEMDRTMRVNEIERVFDDNQVCGACAEASGCVGPGMG
jgi:hypothetical protein